MLNMAFLKMLSNIKLGLHFHMLCYNVSLASAKMCS